MTVMITILGTLVVAGIMLGIGGFLGFILAIALVKWAIGRAAREEQNGQRSR